LQKEPCVAPENRALLSQIVAEAIQSESTSLTIVQNGKTLYHNLFENPDWPRSVQSVTKSIVSLDIMKLLNSGRIASLDSPMSTWIPAWKNDPLKSQITLRMIMNHTSGLPDTDTVTDFFQSPDYIQAAENVALIGTPGGQYKYSTIGITLLQPVVAQASGMSVDEYTRREIFVPLNISDAEWARDHAGHEETGGGLYLCSNDLLRVGKLLLDEGFHERSWIVTSRDIDLLTHKSQSFFNYGLLWWLDLQRADSQNEFEVFSAYGWGGQYMSVYSDKALVVVRTKDPASIDSANADRFNLQSYFDFRNLVSQWQ